MRAALWLMALFGVAVAIAMFAGNNHGTVTVFVTPYRVDLSLNLVLLTLAGGFVILHFATCILHFEMIYLFVCNLTYYDINIYSWTPGS